MGDHLTSFGSIVALPGDFEAAAALAMTSERVPSSLLPSSAAGNPLNFNRMEEQSLMLGAALFGSDWDKVAKFVGSRKAVEVEDYFSQQQLSNPFLDILIALPEEQKNLLVSNLRAASKKLFEEDVSREGPGREGSHVIASALKLHEQGLTSDTSLLEAAITAFGRDRVVASIDLAVCAKTVLKDETSPKPTLGGPSTRQHMTPDISDGIPAWPVVAPLQQPTPPSSHLSGRNKRGGTPQTRQSYDSAYGEPPCKICANCGTSNTPLWRKDGAQHMCNACGIYYKNHGFHRPVDLIKTGSSRQGGGLSHAGSAAGGRQATGGLSYDVAGAGHHHEDTATSPLARNAKARRSPFRQTTSNENEYAAAPSGVGEEVEPNGGSRRSGRRRAAKNLGDDWFEPDELVLRLGQTAGLKQRRQYSHLHPHDSESEFVDEAVSGGPAISGLYSGIPPSGSRYGGRGGTQGDRVSEGAPGTAAGAAPSLSGQGAPLPYVAGRKHTSHLSGDVGGGRSAMGAETTSGVAAAGEEGGDTSDSSDVTDLRVDDDVTHVATALLKLKQAMMIRPRGHAPADPVAAATMWLPQAMNYEDVGMQEQQQCLMADAAMGVWPEGGFDLGVLGAAGGGDVSPMHDSFGGAGGYFEEEGAGEGEQEEDKQLLQGFVRHGKPRKKRGRSHTRRTSFGGGSSGPVTRRPSPDSRNGGGNTVCANCGTSKTPLWRKDRETGLTMCNACGIYKQTHGYDRSTDGTRSAGGDGPPRKRTSNSGAQRGHSGGPARRTSSHGSPSVGQAGSVVVAAAVPTNSATPPATAATTSPVHAPHLPSTPMPPGRSPLSGRPPLPPSRSSGRASGTPPAGPSLSGTIPMSRYYEESLQYQPHPLDTASPLHVMEDAISPLEPAALPKEAVAAAAIHDQGGWGSPVPVMPQQDLPAQHLLHQQRVEAAATASAQAQQLRAPTASSTGRQHPLAMLAEQHMAMLQQLRAAGALTDVLQQQQLEQQQRVALLTQLRLQASAAAAGDRKAATAGTAASIGSPSRSGSDAAAASSRPADPHLESSSSKFLLQAMAMLSQQQQEAAAGGQAPATYYTQPGVVSSQAASGDFAPGPAAAAGDLSRGLLPEAPVSAGALGQRQVASAYAPLAALLQMQHAGVPTAAAAGQQQQVVGQQQLQAAPLPPWLADYLLQEAQTGRQQQWGRGLGLDTSAATSLEAVAAAGALSSSQQQQLLASAAAMQALSRVRGGSDSSSMEAASHELKGGTPLDNLPAV